MLPWKTSKINPAQKSKMARIDMYNLKTRKKLKTHLIVGIELSLFGWKHVKRHQISIMLEQLGMPEKYFVIQRNSTNAISWAIKSGCKSGYSWNKFYYIMKCEISCNI